MPIADVYLGLEMGGFEMIVADLEHFPESHVRIGAMARQVRWRHTKRISLDLERGPAAEKRLARQRINFTDLLVGHGVTAARGAIAVDHEKCAMTVVSAVIGVRKAGIDRKVIIRVRVHLAGRDPVEALGGLAIAFADLRAEIARPAADRIDLEQFEAASSILLPDFELGFFLEDSDQDRGALWHFSLLEQRKQLGRQLFGCFGRQLIAVFGKAAIW